MMSTAIVDNLRGRSGEQDYYHHAHRRSRESLGQKQKQQQQQPQQPQQQPQGTTREPSFRWSSLAESSSSWETTENSSLSSSLGGSFLFGTTTTTNATNAAVAQQPQQQPQQQQEYWLCSRCSYHNSDSYRSVCAICGVGVNPAMNPPVGGGRPSPPPSSAAVIVVEDDNHNNNDSQTSMRTRMSFSGLSMVAGESCTTLPDNVFSLQRLSSEKTFGSRGSTIHTSASTVRASNVRGRSLSQHPNKEKVPNHHHRPRTVSPGSHHRHLNEKDEDDASDCTERTGHSNADSITIVGLGSGGGSGSGRFGRAIPHEDPEEKPSHRRTGLKFPVVVGGGPQQRRTTTVAGDSAEEQQRPPTTTVSASMSPVRKNHHHRRPLPPTRDHSSRSLDSGGGGSSSRRSMRSSSSSSSWVKHNSTRSLIRSPPHQPDSGTNPSCHHPNPKTSFSRLRRRTVDAEMEEEEERIRLPVRSRPIVDKRRIPQPASTLSRRGLVGKTNYQPPKTRHHNNNPTRSHNNPTTRRRSRRVEDEDDEWSCSVGLEDSVSYF